MVKCLVRDHSESNRALAQILPVYHLKNNLAEDPEIYMNPWISPEMGFLAQDLQQKIHWGGRQMRVFGNC